METLVKILELILSAKTAARIVSGSIGSISLYHVLNSKLRSVLVVDGNASETIFYLVIAIGFGLGVLLYDLVAFLAKKLNAKWQKRQKDQIDEQEARKQAETLLEKFDQTFDYLLDEHKMILYTLSDGVSALQTSSIYVQTLEDEGFIIHTLKLDVFSSLYKLNPAIKKAVRRNAGERRYAYYRDRINEATKEERELLMLFAKSKTIDSHHKEESLLPYGFYMATFALERDRILIKELDKTLPHHQEKWRLVKEAIDVVEELIIGGTIHQDTILIDLNGVQASGAGGGGAAPSS